MENGGRGTVWSPFKGYTLGNHARVAYGEGVVGWCDDAG